MLTPRPYQVAGREFLAARRFALLADEMRVGKTPQAILAARYVGARDALVVCPAIAVRQWRDEWARWWPGSKPPHVVSYDTARLNFAPILARRWDVAIVDECHFAKNPGAARTKMVYGKGGLGWQADRMWALSGTPAPKHAGELWPMLFAFGATKLLYDAFIRRYCYVDLATKRIRGTREKLIPEVRAMLEPIMLRRTRKEVAPDMPGIGYSFLNVTPAWEADLPEGVSPEAEWLERNAGSLAEERNETAKAKAPALAKEIEFAVEGGLLRQTVVFGWHIEPLAMIHERLDSAGIRAAVINGATPAAHRQRIQREFAAGQIQVVLANILAAGTAIDLSAARHGYFLELDWLPGNNAQAANRLIAIGKNDPVTFDIVTAPGTIDDAVQKTLLRRTQELSKLY